VRFRNPLNVKTLTSLLRWVKKSGPHETTGIRQRLDGYKLRMSWHEAMYAKVIYLAGMDSLYQSQVVPKCRLALEQAKSAYISECRQIMMELVE
jgi:hypothetical protein